MVARENNAIDSSQPTEVHASTRRFDLIFLVATFVCGALLGVAFVYSTTGNPRVTALLSLLLGLCCAGAEIGIIRHFRRVTQEMSALDYSSAFIRTPGLKEGLREQILIPLYNPHSLNRLRAALRITIDASGGKGTVAELDALMVSLDQLRDEQIAARRVSRTVRRAMRRSLPA